MAEKKLTKRDVLNYMINTYSNDEMVVAYATHEIELLDNKKVSRTETKNQKANAELKGVIVSTLTNLAKPVRISELQNANELLTDLSNQKISALLKQLVDSQVVVKTVEKKVAYFSV